ncbi:hypothetical protein BLA39750_01224 [Burkholderia lata]|uniref:Uncharacterized protein n=1 Tax=Burkholderia lata (strain ATCC 17760 / DSM 23089 / LMG 22485 / NCIMB 9086 / R18194 / 383) TaxID=482957 RepID=A0A6P2V5G8_BURL3|nr:hypothetical protein [Burkholderia lata]VWC81378.1 hypothetical protein BLA39750_01224 [Burkholderia lata]
MGYHHFSIGHEIAVAAVRGVVYAVERHLFRGMSLSEILVIGILIIAVVGLIGRRRPVY